MAAAVCLVPRCLEDFGLGGLGLRWLRSVLNLAGGGVGVSGSSFSLKQSRMSFLISWQQRARTWVCAHPSLECLRCFTVASRCLSSESSPRSNWWVCRSRNTRPIPRHMRAIAGRELHGLGGITADHGYGSARIRVQIRIS
jgi:hypothetical protein